MAEVCENTRVTLIKLSAQYESWGKIAVCLQCRASTYLFQVPDHTIESSPLEKRRSCNIPSSVGSSRDTLIEDEFDQGIRDIELLSSSCSVRCDVFSFRSACVSVYEGKLFSR